MRSSVRNDRTDAMDRFILVYRSILADFSEEDSVALQNMFEILLKDDRVTAKSLNNITDILRIMRETYLHR
jgi:hypothetical protein